MSALCPNCGNNIFECSQRVSVQVVVDKNKHWIRDIHNSIFNAGDYMGPFQCTKCREECDDLKDWQEQETEAEVPGPDKGADVENQ
jgi:hypothetical protein